MAAFAFTATAGLGSLEVALSLAWSNPAGAPRSLRLLRRERNAPTGPDDGQVVLDLAEPDDFPAGTSFTERVDALSGELDRTLTLVDRGPALQAGSTVYYTAFQGTEAAASQMVLITGSHGFAERLFARLPAVHQHYDNPASLHGGSWQLRRFLGLFGAALDHAQGTAAALPSLHDPLTARADVLPYLAQTIGWPLDRTLPVERQRGDILFAPEVFATIGTVPNVQALASRTTGWTCRVKEYVGNVMLTNAAEPIRLWQIFETTAATPADAFAPPVALPELYPLPADAQADPSRVDARPAAVTAPDGTVWLFWHSTRPAAGPVRRRIWLQRPGVDPAPIDALADLEDAPDLFDESPAATIHDGTIWLAWATNRGGHREIWLRAWPGGAMPPGPPRALKQQLAENRSPALACTGAAGSPIAAAWASTQSGQTMIWTSSSADGGGTWSAPAIVSAGPRDRSPAAAFDAAGKLHLYWSADAGVSAHIRHGTLAGAAWTVTDATAASPSIHDDAPCAVLWQAELHLFWHSNRSAAGGRTRIWSETGPVASGVASAMQPAAVVTAGGGLRLFLASQETGARFRSRTVDTADALARTSMGSFDDRMHYTYDTRRVPEARIARDTAALFLSPNDGHSPADHTLTVQRLRAFLAPFRPVTTRFVYLVEHAAGAGFTPIASDP